MDNGEIAILIIILILAVFIGIYLGIGYYFYSLALNPKNKKLMGTLIFTDENNTDPSQQENIKKWNSHNEWFANSGYTHEYITAKDNVRLHGVAIRHKQSTNKWAVLLHGYRGKCFDMQFIAYHFYNMGFNILMPDLRGCGQSGGKCITIGFTDSKDTLCWIRDFIIYNDDDAEIVVTGISMGGATTMMLTGLPLPKNVKVAVEDCGYTNAYEQFKYILTNAMKLPKFPFLPATDIFVRLMAGFSLKKASCIKRVENSDTPTLFIHGDNDTFVPFYMLEEVYNACGTNKKAKLIIKDAPHGMCALTDTEGYFKGIREFVGKYIEISNS